MVFCVAGVHAWYSKAHGAAFCVAVVVFCGVRGRVRAVFTRPFSEFTSLPFASFLGVAVISSCKVSGNLARFGFIGFLDSRYFEIERVLEAIFEVRESIGFA